MICPKCKGKVTVTDTVNNNEGNETLRERTCNVCGHIFYTTEYITYLDQAFQDDWKKYYRKRKVKKERL